MRVYTVTCRKGGVGKTTTVSALAAVFRKAGKRVLAIDLDSQQNLTYTYGIREADGSALDLLVDHAPIRNVIQTTKQGDIIPGSGRIAVMDQRIKNNALKIALRSIRRDYDYILIDTPAQLGNVAVTALTASDGVIVPVVAEVYCLQGLEPTFELINAVQSTTNPDLQIEGLLLTRVGRKTVLSGDMAHDLARAAKTFKAPLFKTRIRERVGVGEAAASQTNIIDYEPRSAAALDYIELAKELTNKKEGVKNNGKGI